MLILLKQAGRAIALPVTLAFVVAMIPHLAEAQAPKQDKKRILFVPLQRSEHVPENAAPRIEEYLRALIEIDPVLALVPYVEEAPPAQEQLGPPEAKPAEARENPNIEKARALMESGRAQIQKKRYEAGLLQLVKAEKLFRDAIVYLENFDEYVDTILWTAAGFILGGFREEAGPALRSLVTMRPDIILPASEFDQKVIQAVEAAKARVAEGGLLRISVEGAEANVFVDGRLVGQGSQVVGGLKQGRHFVRVVAPGFPPQGKFVTLGARESSVVFAFGEKKRKEVAAPRVATPLTHYARTGDFSGAFAQDALETARKSNSHFVVLGYVARSDAGFHVGLFLFDVATSSLAAIEPAVVDNDFANLQLSLLELESRLSQAVQSFPQDQVVRGKPAIYAIAPKTRAAPSVAEAPQPPPVPVPTPIAEQPRPAAQPAAPKGLFEELPPDFPVESVVRGAPEKAWYEKWWVWAAIGGAAAVGLGTGLGLYLGKGSTGGQGTFGAKVLW